MSAELRKPDSYRNFLGKKYELDKAGVKAFEALKTGMVSAPALIAPNFS